MIDSIPVQIWSGQPEGTLDFCNARWRAETGLTLDQLQGDGWQQMLHPEDKARVLQAWDESVRTAKPYEQEERHRMADGSYRWFLARGVPLREENGKIVRWFGCNTDIEDQKRAENALRKSEERWRGVFENSRVGVALLDRSFRFLEANTAYERIVGIRREELLAMHCLELIYECDRRQYEMLVDELLSGKRHHFEIEKRYIRKNGEPFWVCVNGSLVDTTDACVWVVMAEDINERKRLGNELLRERDRLRLLLDLSDRFISNLDIREFFDGLMDGVRRLAGWDWATILTPGPNANQLTVQLSPANAYLREGDTLPIDGCLQGQVFRSGNPVAFRIEDLPELCPLYRENRSMQEIAVTQDVKMGCIVPLVHAGKRIGVLFLATREARDPADVPLDMLRELANLVATAFHNTLRFEDVNQSRARLLTERDYMEAEFLRERGISGIIGDSAAITEVLRQINVVAPADSTVLITGETGTGKELVARAIHERSPRRDHSFIKVDCAAIPATLMESELFGHEKGAFTGAVAQKLGRFEIADHGTIFLDEIGDIPLELQTKLLRVLQDHAFERLGSTRTRSVDVRVIAATHRNLEEMVEQGTFREDLYYRLKVFPIGIPPLRERPADIPELVDHYVATYSRRLKKPVPVIPAAVMAAFVRYPWPGNVRELQHFIERSAVLTSGGQLQAPIAELDRLTNRHANRFMRRGRTMEQIERDSIQQALEESNWVIGGPHGAAAKLGLKRTTLASRMKKLRLTRRVA